MVVAEFDRDCGNDEADNICMKILDNVNADPEETWWNWLVLVALFCVFRLLALVVLRSKATKFF